MYPHYFIQHHPRSLVDLGSSSNRTLLIVICVVAAVGGLIFTIIFIRTFRIIFRLDQYRPSPLPPIQPLAHHREQQVALFVERNGSDSTPATWYGSYLTIPTSDSMPKGGSEISLLHRDPSSTSPSVSLGFSESSTTDEATVLSSAKPLELPPPSSFPDNPSLEVAESQPMPTTLRSHTSQSTNSTHLTTARPRPQSASRPRPVSMSSVTSTALTPRNSRIIRGPPHGPHSKVQVVLPTPLAPSLYAHMASDDPSRKRHSIGFTPDGSKRLSVVDQWAQIPIRSSSRERRSLSISMFLIFFKTSMTYMLMYYYR
jgi:hypothetical protein